MKDGIIRIKTDIYSNLVRFLVLIILIENNFFSIIQFPFDTIRKYLIIAVASIICFVWLSINTRYRKEIKSFTKFIDIYITMTMVCMAIHTIYATIHYGQTVLDVVLMSTQFYILFLIYTVLNIFVRQGGDSFRFIRILAYFGLFHTIIILIEALLMNNGIYNFALSGIQYLGYRNGNIRLIISITSIFSPIIFFAFFINEKIKIKKILYLVIALFEIFSVTYFLQVRMILISTISAMFFMWFFKRRPSNNRIIVVCTTIILIIVSIKLGAFTKLIESFSTSGEQGNSTIARLNAIQYFTTYVKKNPLLGMSFIRPYTARLRAIWSGPTGTAYFDDLGYLGLFFQTGLTSLILFILPMIRMLYIWIKLFKNNINKEEFILCTGFLAYLITSSASLAATDKQRILIFVICISWFEYVYIKRHKVKTN